MEMPDVNPDPAVTLTFLQWLTRRWPELGTPCGLELRALDPDAAHRNKHAQFTPDRIDEAVAWARDMAARGLNIYTVVNPITPYLGRPCRDSDVLGAFFHFADADDPRAAENLKAWRRDQIGPVWSAAVITGTIPTTRVHVYWELSEPQRDLEAWRRTQIAIARRFASDGAVINPSRIMRLPGCATAPGEKKRALGYVSEVATLRRVEAPTVDAERLGRVFDTQPASAPQSGAESGFSFDTRTQALDRARAKGAASSGEEWHNNVIRLVASYVSRGLTDDEIHALTDPLTLPGFTVEQTRAEVQTAINGARAKGWTPQQYADPEAAFDAATPAKRDATPLEWFDDIEPSLTDSYIIKDVMQAGALTALYGAPNTGKTFFVLDMAFAIACGGPWRGKRVTPGGVLYLAAEGGRGVVNRIAALKHTHGVCDVPLALRRAGLDLLRSDADIKTVVALAREVEQRAPLRLIVVDTLSRVMAGGDENAATDMTALIRNIDAIRAATGAHVLLVHHSGKDEGRGARGHSSLKGAVDTEIEIVSAEEGRAAVVRKQRDYQGGETWAFSLKPVSLGTDQDGDEVTSCVVECEDDDGFIAARSAKKGLGGNQKIIAETFDQMLAEGMGKPNPGGVGMPEAGQFWAVQMDDLRRIARGKMPGKDTRGAFNQAFNALTGERGLFGAGEMLVWRIDRKCR